MKANVWRLLAAALFALAALPGAAAAAQDRGDTLTVEAADASGYPTVQLTLTAPRSLVGDDLPARAFELTENGTPRRVQVSRLPDEELQVVLLVDTSGSMTGPPLDAVKQAAASFVERMPTGAQISVVEYATEPRAVSPFTDDHAATKAAVAGLQAGGRTATYDAIAMSVAQFDSLPKGRRAVVLISDGEDNESATALDEAAELLASAGVTLQVVELETRFSDADALRHLAAAGGGEVVSIDDPAALTEVYDDIASKLLSQYRLEYRSGAHGQARVRVSVEHEGVRAGAVHSIDLPAAPPPTPEPEPEPTTEPTVRVLSVDDSNYPLVEVTVVAPRPLADTELGAETFELLEDGHAPSLTVTPVGPTNVDVVLAIDVSGSMRGQALDDAKAAATQFVRHVPEGTQIAVLAFASQPQLIKDFTEDTRALERAIAGLEATSETALYDALVVAAGLFEAREPAVRYVLVLSDGGDTVSQATEGTAISSLEEAGASLEGIEFVTSEHAPKALAAVAEPTGGTVAAAEDSDELAYLYEGFATDVGNQYVLTYRSSRYEAADIDVAVQGDGWVARTTQAIVLPPLPWSMQLLSSPWGMGLGALFVYAGTALLILLILAPKPLRTTLHGAVWDSGAARPRSGRLASLGTWAEEQIERTLRRRGLGEALNRQLEQAGILLKPSEFVVIAGAAGLVALAIGMLVHGPLLAVPFAAATVYGFRVYLNFRRKKRREAFSAQLADTLQLLSGSLRAGYGLLQAVDAVAQDAESPTADEFRRIVVETRLGRDLPVALRAMSDRMHSDDFSWVVQAIEIHREVGGDLAEVLDRVGETIRAREQIARQIKSLSAEGRLSAKILIGLPFVVMAGFSLLNPGYLAELLGSGIGRLLLAIAGGFLTVGAVWINRLVKIEF